MAQDRIGARAFLGKEGFVFDKKPGQLDRLFLKEFSPEDAADIRRTWEAIHLGGIPSTVLYQLPRTARQANILFSQDRARYVATFDWLQSEIAHWRPQSIVEMGCGTGTFLRFVRTNFPGTRLKGVDAEEALVAISRTVSDIDVKALDYLSAAADDEKCEVVVCNFGFDLSRFRSSTTPHTIETIGRSAFCPGCSDDFAAQFEEYIRNWRAGAHWKPSPFSPVGFPHLATSGQ
ncbi:class I SAM-dependent methyltransferase [Mesorhizobium sp. L2C084A000]|uniref:methyltransferase domain-containing protein n=1 Tax=Mesorhizobium sp. L2C084A000 TaxID=1287116 RepID=UPI0004CE9E31|nr:class I SAM-dependent methyltransferase [Mesorhizobium sp. L2C084A000]